MIQEFVDRFMANKPAIQAVFQQAHPEDYLAVVSTVIQHIVENDWEGPDATRIHQIDDGDYQGTLLFVIPEIGYQPHKYYYVMVDYGSCSGCDTLQRIRDYSDLPPTEQQVADYMTLALHIVQKLKVMSEDTV